MNCASNNKQVLEQCGSSRSVLEELPILCAHSEECWQNRTTCDQVDQRCIREAGAQELAEREHGQRFSESLGTVGENRC